jgi:hypothetical protein
MEYEEDIRKYCFDYINLLAHWELMAIPVSSSDGALVQTIRTCRFTNLILLCQGSSEVNGKLFFFNFPTTSNIHRRLNSHFAE